MEPRVEPVRIPEGSQVPPGDDERLLDRVLGQVIVVEHQLGEVVELADPRARRGRRTIRDRRVVPAAPGPAARGPRLRLCQTSTSEGMPASHSFHLRRTVTGERSVWNDRAASRPLEPSRRSLPEATREDPRSAHRSGIPGRDQRCATTPTRSSTRLPSEVMPDSDPEVPQSAARAGGNRWLCLGIGVLAAVTGFGFIGRLDGDVPAGRARRTFGPGRPPVRPSSPAGSVQAAAAKDPFVIVSPIDGATIRSTTVEVNGCRKSRARDPSPGRPDRERRARPGGRRDRGARTGRHLDRLSSRRQSRSRSSWWRQPTLGSMWCGAHCGWAGVVGSVYGRPASCARTGTPSSSCPVMPRWPSAGSPCV